MSKSKKIEEIKEQVKKEAGIKVASEPVNASAPSEEPHIKIRGFRKIAESKGDENVILKGNHSKTPTVEDLAGLMSQLGNNLGEFQTSVSQFQTDVCGKLSDHESRIKALEERVNPQKAAPEPTPGVKDAGSSPAPVPNSTVDTPKEPDSKASTKGTGTIDLSKDDVIIDIILPGRFSVEFH